MAVRVYKKGSKHSKERDFINSQGVGVLATVNKDGVPHAATVYVIADKELDIYFLTKDGTSKHVNLLQNNKAALVVYDPHSLTTIQIQGTAKVTKDDSMVDYLYARILTTNKEYSGNDVPPIDRIDAGKYVAYRLSPETVRLIDYWNLDLKSVAKHQLEQSGPRKRRIRHKSI